MKDAHQGRLNAQSSDLSGVHLQRLNGQSSPSCIRKAAGIRRKAF
jgi:hypothetical protein